jgi:hypothetical protein
MLTAFVLAAASEEKINENVPNHWLIGGVALGILLFLLLALLVFGAGREHS